MARPGVNACAPALIRHTPTLGDEGSTTDIRRLVPAWIFSGIIHVVLLSLLLLITVSSAPATPEPELSQFVANVEEPRGDENLTNPDIGNDSELLTQYNLERLGDTSTPGPNNLNEKAGILNAPEAPPQIIPPPPGMGSNAGQGGAIDDPTRDGRGSILGERGGMGGTKFNNPMYGGRSGETRERALRTGGGNTRSEACVARGLEWLAPHQASDGSWGPASFHRDGKNCNCSGPGQDDRMFGTALALLSFLGAGEAHRGVNKHSIYAKNVERAMKWIVSRQNADGVLSGNGYIHGMAALALVELYGLTADPQLKGPAQRAIDAIVKWQAADGGFRYGPKQPGDTSVTGWHIQALKSGQMAGLHVPNATLAQCINFLDKVSSPDGSVVGYMTPDDRPEHTRTQSIGLLCRMYLNNWGPRHPGMAKGVELLRAKHSPTPIYKDMYYYYYATQLLHHFGGKEWEQWNNGVNGKPGMRDILIERQDQGQNTERRHQKGSWDPAGDAFGQQFGRLGHTCLCILTLEVYYRHLPLYRRELGAMKNPAARNGAQ